MRSVRAFARFRPGSNDFPRGQRLSVPELFMIALKTGMFITNGLNIIPEQQRRESLQGYFRRLLTNRLPHEEGIAMVYTVISRLYITGVANNSYFEHACRTLAEVIMRRLPDKAEDLVIFGSDLVIDE